MNSWFLLAAIPVFGICILVHEFGHFITAKWAGIRVEEFGLGFPPRIVGIQKKDSGGWRVIWLGGGQNAEDEYEEDGVLKQTPFGGTSGGISRAGAQHSNHTIYSLNFLPIGGFVRMPGENGDVNDVDGHYDPESFAAKSAGKRVIVLCAGVTMNVILAMVLFSIAYTLGEPTYPAVIGNIESGSPAALAGMRPGDTILSVNGQPVHLFSDLVTDVDTIVTAHSKQARVPVQLVIEHQGQKTPIIITVNARVNPPPNKGHLGVEEKIVYVSSPIWEAPFKGVQHTVVVTGEFISQIGMMIVGAVKPQFAGPVGIVKITGQVAQTIPDLGWWPILSLTAVLSLNLAIINILPFPALDGGRVLLIVIELLRGGKRMKPEREGIINLVGIAILLTLMVVITVSDIVHWGS